MNDRTEFVAAARQCWSALTDGDRSTLVAALNEPGARMMTAAGSGNFAFWSLLETEGLMKNLGPPEGIPETFAIFAVCEGKGAQITELLQLL